MDELRYQVDLLKAQNDKLLADERIYRLIFEFSNKAFLYYNHKTKQLKAFGKWMENVGTVPKDYNDCLRFFDLVDDSVRNDIMPLFYPEEKKLRHNSFEVPLQGMEKWYEVSCDVTYDEFGIPLEKVISFQDNSKKHQYLDELTFMSRYDYQTNLYNRNYFISKLNGFIEKAASENAVVSVILLDIDDFSKINDVMGIVLGDEVIQNFGLYLRGFVCDDIIAARFDSDIYSIAVYNPSGNKSVDDIYKTVVKHLKKPMILSNRSTVTFTVSAGVAEYPEASDNALKLINSAEVVLVKAKEAGKNTIMYFNANVHEEFMSNLMLENKLKAAINNMSFYVCFQPQFFCEGGRLRGVEALARWKDEDGNMISPAVFIPMSERNGTIIPLGDYIIDESVKTFMEWKKRYDVSMILSVNISAIQYKRADFVSKVVSTVKKYNMIPSELELEITESVLIDDFKMVVNKMEELRDFGIKVSIDDFGTGFSSLQYLKGLPVDTLKIDKSFIDSVIDDDASKTITESIISMSKKLGYETIAEGVEYEAQYDYLKSVDCDLIQGYYLGKPMAATAIEEILLRMI